MYTVNFKNLRRMSTLCESEDGFGPLGPAPAQKAAWRKALPGTFKAFADACRELFGQMGVQPRDMVENSGIWFKGGDARDFFALASGEAQDGRLTLTLENTGGMPLPQSLGFLLVNGQDEIKRAGSDDMPILFTDGNLDYGMTELELLKFDLPAAEAVPPRPLYVIHVGVAKSAKSGASLKSAECGRVDTAADFLAAISRLRTESRRDIDSFKAICFDDERKVGYSIQPRAVKDGQMTFTLQKLFEGVDPMQDPEVWTFRQLAAWIRQQNMPKAHLFLKARDVVYGIDGIEFPAGRPPAIFVAPWADLFESAGRRPSPPKRTARAEIEAWGKACREPILSWPR